MGQLGVDPEFRDKLRAVLTDWCKRGLVLPGWHVVHDSGDGCYRSTFTLRTAEDDRHYSFNEAEMCQYVIGLADLAPVVAGEPAQALADASREETQR